MLAPVQNQLITEIHISSPHYYWLQNQFFTIQTFIILRTTNTLKSNLLFNILTKDRRIYNAVLKSQLNVEASDTKYIVRSEIGTP